MLLKIQHGGQLPSENIKTHDKKKSFGPISAEF